MNVRVFWIIAVIFSSFHTQNRAHSAAHQTAYRGTSGYLPADELENEYNDTGHAYFISNFILHEKKKVNFTDIHLIQQL